MTRLLLVLTLLLGAATTARAGPLVYVTGSECPSDAQMADTTLSYERQYSVTPSLRCMYDGEPKPNDAINNVVGSQAEADAYLNTLQASLAGWGSFLNLADNWVGLTQNPAGFSFTVDDPATNDSGTFTIDQSILDYDQFAIGIKDGAIPFWAIFQLSVDQTTGDWLFSTEGGDLSHFALFGRNIPPNCPDCVINPEIIVTPEPASMFMLGTGLLYGANRVRRRRRS